MTIDPLELLDPPRLEDEGTVAERQLMRRYRRGPSTQAVGRLSERLAAAGIMRVPSSDATRLAGARAASYKIGGVALLLAGGLLVAWEGAHPPVPPPRASAPAHTAAMLSDSPSVTDPPLAAPAKTDAISVNELPTAAPAADLGPASASPKVDSRRNAMAPNAASAMDGRSPPTSAGELELVQRAEAALASDPQRALALAKEHARVFPSGEFLQEREVIAVDALVRLGRKDESLRRGRALVQRFPQTPYAARVELAVGQSLTSPANSAAPPPIKNP
ncbi:MAG: hypothetical protein K0S65_4449 [Labilithrix sp.]|nr:hypothetical protein [Labilithrix sp.]